MNYLMLFQNFKANKSQYLLNKTTEILIVYKYLKKGLEIDHSATPYPGPWRNSSGHKIVFKK